MQLDVSHAGRRDFQISSLRSKVFRDVRPWVALEEETHNGAIGLLTERVFGPGVGMSFAATIQEL